MSVNVSTSPDVFIDEEDSEQEKMEENHRRSITILTIYTKVRLVEFKCSIYLGGIPKHVPSLLE